MGSETSTLGYGNSLKVYRDMKGVIETARDEGKAEGKTELRIEIAKALKQNGASVELISLKESKNCDSVTNVLL